MEVNANFTFLSLYPRVNSPPLEIQKNAVWTQSRYERYGQEETLFALAGIEPSYPG
jgi:hypothetical protein